MTSHHLWGQWYPLSQTLVDSAHGFQSHGGFVIAHFRCSILILRVISDWPGTWSRDLLHVWREQDYWATLTHFISWITILVGKITVANLGPVRNHFCHGATGTPVLDIWHTCFLMDCNFPVVVSHLCTDPNHGCSTLVIVRELVNYKKTGMRKNK